MGRICRKKKFMSGRKSEGDGILIIISVNVSSIMTIYNISCTCLQAHDEEVTNHRAAFEQRATEIEQKYERKMRALRDELDLRRKTELHEVDCYYKELISLIYIGCSDVTEFMTTIRSPFLWV